MSSKFGQIPASAPIKGYSHRGFIMGWCAIMVASITAFGLLALPLDFTRADVDTITTGSIQNPSS